MNERDSRRYEEHERQRQGSDSGARSEYGTRHASEDRDGPRAGRYGGSSEAGRAARMGRQYGSDMGREESDWSQGRREAQRWGEQGTYGAQGSNEFERYGSEVEHDRGYSGQFSDRVRDEYAQGRDHVSQERDRYANQDYSNQRGFGTQAHGQGEQSYGTHGYGSGREFRGYEGGGAGRRAGGRHWERGFGEGYGMSSGYADEQAYDSRYGASGYATGYASSRDAGSGYGAPSSPRDYSRNYRGMGPKSYTRSDERVLEDVNERLTEDDYLDASDITVRCVNGVITLEGTVADRWMKHRAEDLADVSSGVKQVDNRIQVRSQSARTGSEQKPGDSTSAQSRSRQAGSAGAAARGSGENPGSSSPH